MHIKLEINLSNFKNRLHKELNADLKIDLIWSTFCPIRSYMHLKNDLASVLKTGSSGKLIEKWTKILKINFY